MPIDEFGGTEDNLARWHPERARKPDVVPSKVPYVRLAKNPEAGTVSVTTPEFCTREGFTLRALIATLWDVPESRIEFVAPIEEDARFDAVLVPPDPKDVEIEALMREGITTHFGLDLSFEVRPMDVLVLSAPDGIVGIGPAGCGAMSFCGMFALDEPGVSGIQEVREGFEQRVKAAPGAMMFPESPGELNVGGTGTVELVRDMLEQVQDRLVVDESGAEGSFDVDIRVDSGIDGFIAMLREQLGIVTTPSRRDVRMLVVRPL
jgi:uncharacterized protein (TIGR03435 family)